MADSNHEKVVMMGTFSCRDGESEAMDRVLTEMVAASADEPGVEQYSYHRGPGNRYWFFAVMANAEAAENHGRTQGMQNAMQAFGPLVDEPPQVTPLTPVAAFGWGPGH